ncbi:hypothetical protein AK965_11815 [Vibrio sp. PID17_43]|nr:hypothetical protein AK965_11815 [Vibrio sp. PID17_43]
MKAYEFLHTPYGIWWPLPDLNWGPIDYERSPEPIRRGINIATLPRITLPNCITLYPARFLLTLPTDFYDDADEEIGGITKCCSEVHNLQSICAA